MAAREVASTATRNRAREADRQKPLLGTAPLAAKRIEIARVISPPFSRRALYPSGSLRVSGSGLAAAHRFAKAPPISVVSRITVARERRFFRPMTLIFEFGRKSADF